MAADPAGEDLAGAQGVGRRQRQGVIHAANHEQLVNTRQAARFDPALTTEIPRICRELHTPLPHSGHIRPAQGLHRPSQDGDTTMTALIQLTAEISFMDLGLGLVAVGIAERIALNLPEDMVGPGGWLLDTGSAK